MATTRTISSLAGLAATLGLLGAAPPPRDDIAAARPLATHEEQEESEEHEAEGYAPAEARQQEPDALEAACPFESYRPGTIASLRIWTPTRRATIRVFRVGPERQPTIGNSTLEGVPMSGPR